MEEKTFPFEIKSVTDEGTFEGYCAIFNKPDAMGEIIEPGAFTKTLKEGGDTRPMLWYHNSWEPMGTVDLEADKKGLKVKGLFDLNVQMAREKHSLMKNKAIKGLSFGFKTIIDLWDKTTRYLKEVKLWEVSPCTFQAHPDALVTSVKSIKFETFEDATISLNKAIKYFEEQKSGKIVSAANLKLLNNAVTSLAAILKKLEPSDDTQADKKSMFLSVIEGLETESKPPQHLFGSTIKTLENTN